MSIFSFLDYNYTKYEWIFTKLGMCIDIVDICFGIANGRILSIFSLPAYGIPFVCCWSVQMSVRPAVCPSVRRLAFHIFNKSS